MTSDHSGFVYEVGEIKALSDKLRPWSMYSFAEMHQATARDLFGQAADMLEKLAAAMATNLRICASPQVSQDAAPTPAEPSDLRDSAAALVAKLDECQQGIVSMAAFAAAHHYGYSGPSYHAEHEALRAALKAPAEPSEEEVERVARALYDWDHADCPPPREEPLWDDNHWRHVIGESYLSQARAAIAALRAPSGRVEKEVG